MMNQMQGTSRLSRVSITRLWIKRESSEFGSISGVSVALAELLGFVQGETIMGAAELGIAITELALKYGVPLALDLASTWKQNLAGREPTKEDIEALRVVDPATFFDLGGPPT